MKALRIRQENMQKVDVRQLSDRQLIEAMRLNERALELARLGGFDAVWDEAKPIDGRSQRDIFFEGINRNISNLTAEINRRRFN